MELFRGNETTFKFVIKQGEAFHLHLGYNVIDFQKVITGIALPTNELSGKGTFIIDSTLSINETILC
jgi:hypothetical protein